MVPLTHASVCLSAHNVGATLAAWLAGPIAECAAAVPCTWPDLRASGCVGGRIECGLHRGFDAAAFFGWLTEFRPTWYTAVPAIHRALLSAARSPQRDIQPSSLRLIRSASSSSAVRRVLSGLEALFGVPVIDTYGMTEAASQIAANPLERRKPGSVGKSAGAEIAIMDE